MILYHTTDETAALAIIAEGFRDGEGRYMTRNIYRGVWLADQPLDANEGAFGDFLLAIEMRCTEADIAEYEWVEAYKPGFPGLGVVLAYNRASYDRINKGFPQRQGHEARRIQWVKAARMPFA